MYHDFKWSHLCYSEESGRRGRVRFARSGSEHEQNAATARRGRQGEVNSMTLKYNKPPTDSHEKP